MWRSVISAPPSLLSAKPCQAACHYDRFRIFYGSDASTTMHVSVGAQCTIKLFLGHTESIKSIAVTEQAKHGSASYNGGIGYPEIAYQSSPAYKGGDAFAFTVMVKTYSAAASQPFAFPWKSNSGNRSRRLADVSGARSR